MSNEYHTGRMSLDAKVFLAVVASGFALMMILKLLSLPQLLVTLILMGVVAAYAALVVLLPRLRLRTDQAGDNAYYLGLVFTLFSMGYALYSIGRRLQLPDQGSFSVTETVIGDFGIALGTTLAGIICRIVLHQMRVDLTDVEEQSRIHLVQASNNMVAQLNNLSAGFGEFILKLQQKQLDHAAEMADLHKKMQIAFDEQINGSAQRSVTLLETTGGRIHSSITEFTKIADSLTQALKEATERLSTVEAPPTKLSRQFTLFTTKVEKITESLSGTSAQLESNFDRLGAIANEIEKVVKHMAEVAPTVKDSLKQHDSEYAEVMAQTKRELSQLQVTLGAFKETAAKLEVDAERSREAVALAESASVEVLDRLTKVVSRVGLAVEPVQVSHNEPAEAHSR